MRHWLSWVISCLGALCALFGIAIMAVLGPDSRFAVDKHPVDTDGIAVVTAPKVISYKNLKVDILAEVPTKKAVFVGLGNSIDVQSYLARTQRLEVTSFRTPWSVKTREVPGQTALRAAPTALDWWISSSAGLGGASISTMLPDETVSVAVLAVGSTNLSGLQVSFAYGIEGGFVKGAGLTLLGLGGLLLGRVLRQPISREGAAGPEFIEETVYIYTDEDGVDHEINEDQLADFTVVDEDTEEREA